MTAAAIPAGIPLHQSWEFELPVPCGIVVGVDGSEESIAAFNTAVSIAGARRCALHVVSVIPPFPSYQIGPESEQSRSNVEQLRIQLRESTIREMMRQAGDDPTWTHQVVMGRPAKTIVRIAEEQNADLILLGRREHGVMDRIMEGETTLQVMRISPIPVLAVPVGLDQLRSIVVAIDFSAPSARAAKAAVELLGGSGTLYLVYVEPPVELLPEGFAMTHGNGYPGDVVVWFRRLMESLHTPADVIVEPIVLNGKPAQSIVEFTERVGADMIAAGSHGHSRMERLFLGSVSTDLVRRAACPVLVSPAGE